MFYKKSEQPLRNAITFGAYSSVINGLISFGVTFIPTGATAIASWRWLFIVVGGVTVLYAIFVFFYLPDNPGNAKWLTEREKAMVIARVRENQTGIENKKWKWYQLKEALVDYKTWLLFFFIIGVEVPNGGLNTFNSLVINAMGFSTRTTTLLGMPTGNIAPFSSFYGCITLTRSLAGMFSTLAAVIASFFAQRTKRWRTLIMGLVLIIPIIGTILNISKPQTTYLSPPAVQH